MNRDELIDLLNQAETIDTDPPYRCMPMQDKEWTEIKADRILSLIEGELAKAALWDKVKDTHEFKFVRHIESHLSGNQVPICTICGKTIFEIALEGKEGEDEG